MFRYLCTATDNVKYISPMYKACNSALHYELDSFRSCKKILLIKGRVAPEATLSVTKTFTTASTTTIIATSMTLTPNSAIRAIGVEPIPYYRILCSMSSRRITKVFLTATAVWLPILRGHTHIANKNLLHDTSGVAVTFHWYEVCDLR
jgi:hypothetical protein